MSQKTAEELEFEQHYKDNILDILDGVVVQVAEEQAAELRRKARAREWQAQIPAEWTANAEQRCAEEIADWQAAGMPEINE